MTMIYFNDNDCKSTRIWKTFVALEKLLVDLDVLQLQDLDGDATAAG